MTKYSSNCSLYSSIFDFGEVSSGKYLELELISPTSTTRVLCDAKVITGAIGTEYTSPLPVCLICPVKDL
jgi:hypothetical protein